MKRTLAVSGLLAIAVVNAGAQIVAHPPAARQIATAVSPLPEQQQAAARVLGYNAQGKLVVLRPGSNDFTCIADDGVSKQYHVACYHKSLEGFMARGRELHAMKKSREAIDSVRGADIKAGRFTMPSRPAALYQYYASRDSVDASGSVKGASYLYVVYTPYATAKTTGITENPIEGGPWIMYPGKPWAHMMIQPQKTAAVTVK
ncbi:MAG TPA: hypothetical protein VM053_00755 [Gemmatimonadaceae bacterium]|nr:hypothetical protein [Gemmatimonadaceae bacterium]